MARGYIGVNGKARKFWSTGEARYYTTLTDSTYYSLKNSMAAKWNNCYIADSQDSWGWYSDPSSHINNFMMVVNSSLTAQTLERTTRKSNRIEDGIATLPNYVITGIDVDQFYAYNSSGTMTTVKVNPSELNTTFEGIDASNMGSMTNNAIGVSVYYEYDAGDWNYIWTQSTKVALITSTLGHTWLDRKNIIPEDVSGYQFQYIYSEKRPVVTFAGAAYVPYQGRLNDNGTYSNIYWRARINDSGTREHTFGVTLSRNTDNVQTATTSNYIMMAQSAYSSTCKVTASNSSGTVSEVSLPDKTSYPGESMAYLTGMSTPMRAIFLTPERTQQASVDNSLTVSLIDLGHKFKGRSVSTNDYIFFRGQIDDQIDKTTKNGTVIYSI